MDGGVLDCIYSGSYYCIASDGGGHWWHASHDHQPFFKFPIQANAPHICGFNMGNEITNI